MGLFTWQLAVGNPDCNGGTSIPLKNLGTGITLQEYKVSCEKHDSCTDITWAEIVSACVLFAGCTNAGSNSSWQHHALLREQENDLMQATPLGSSFADIPSAGSLVQVTPQSDTGAESKVLLEVHAN